MSHAASYHTPLQEYEEDRRRRMGGGSLDPTRVKFRKMVAA